MTIHRNGTGMSSTGEPGRGAQLDSKLDSLKEKAKDIVEQGSEKVDQLKHRVVEVKDQAMARGNAFIDNLISLIKAHPIKSIAVAFGVGYLGMRLVRRR